MVSIHKYYCTVCLSYAYVYIHCKLYSYTSYTPVDLNLVHGECMARYTAPMGHLVLYEFSYSTGSYKAIGHLRQCYDNNSMYTAVLH